MQVHTPGETTTAAIPAQEAGKSDVDAATGALTARKVAKPRPAVPEAVVERTDTLRPPDAVVNLPGEITYDQAMAALESGTLRRAVLTDKGWVVPPGREPPRGARV